MRNWINLCEGSFTEKPSFTLAVTDELVSEIIQSGKWVDHGGFLEDWWDQSDEYIYLGGGIEVSDILGARAKEICALPWEEVSHLPEIKEIVTRVLLSSAQQYDDNLVIEGLTWLYRGIVIPEGKDFYSSHPLGRFWSTAKSQGTRFMDKHELGSRAILLQAAVKDCDIDWKETIRSRLDQFHGDEEEIQLQTGSPIRFHAQEWVTQPNGATPKFVKNLGWFTGVV